MEETCRARRDGDEEDAREHEREDDRARHLLVRELLVLVARHLRRVGEGAQAEHEGLDEDTPHLLYNLPAVVKAREVYVVEGEKDCETLRSFGIVATSNSGGGSNRWDNDQNHWFAGKDVVVICDNDPVGQQHGATVNSILKGIARSVKVITLSKLPKGDVTDWVQKEGGTAALLRELVKHTDETDGDSPEIAKAKLANETPFSNFCEKIVAGKGGRSKTLEIPFTIRELAQEVHDRFLGYPRVLGETMFDWDRDARRIVFLTSKNELFAWIASTSRHNTVWGTGNNDVTKDELFCELNRTSIHYSGVSEAPHYPTRRDVFYTHDALPKADPSHSSFWQLVDYFCPASPAHKTLVAAFIAAPLFYSESAARPMWIVDTDDAQGSGKTTLVNLVANLYGEDPSIFDLKAIDKDLAQVMRRMISTDGRKKRVVLIDNVTGTLKSSNLATLVTVHSLTGEVKDYMTRNRLQIFADLIHMIENNPLKVRRRKSRFGMFDKLILSAVCRSEDEFRAVDKAISAENDRANEDQDKALEFLEIFMEAIADSEDVDVEKPFFVRSSDINYLLENTPGEMSKWTFAQVQQLVRQGMLDGFDRKFDRIPKGYEGVPRWRGILHGDRGTGASMEVQVLERKQGRTFKVMGNITLLGSGANGKED